MKAIIDVDDVIALDHFLGMLNAFNNSNYKYSDINCYYVEEILDEDRLEEYKKYFIKNNVYDYARIAPNCIEVLMELMLYYDIYPCSSYYSDLHNDIISELLPKKCEFLKKTLPFISSKNYIFTNDKNVIDADLKIDDKISNLSGSGLKILFSAYHNLNIDDDELLKMGIIRANNWLEVREIVRENVKKINAQRVLLKSIYK